MEGYLVATPHPCATNSYNGRRYACPHDVRNLGWHTPGKKSFRNSGSVPNVTRRVNRVLCVLWYPVIPTSRILCRVLNDVRNRVCRLMVSNKMSQECEFHLRCLGWQYCCWYSRRLQNIGPGRAADAFKSWVCNKSSQRPPLDLNLVGRLQIVSQC